MVNSFPSGLAVIQGYVPPLPLRLLYNGWPCSVLRPWPSHDCGGTEPQKVYVSDCDGFRAEQHRTGRRESVDTSPGLEGVCNWAIMNGVMPSLAA